MCKLGFNHEGSIPPLCFAVVVLKIITFQISILGRDKSIKSLLAYWHLTPLGAVQDSKNNKIKQMNK